MAVGDWLSLAGLLVSVVGFGFAIWQLMRTANASIATKKAVERTEKRMALNHLLVLLPQFRLLENDLDHAAQEDDRPLARRTLVSYAHFASEVAAILQGQDSVDQSLIAELRNTARDASRTKGALIDAPIDADIRQLTKDARMAISNISMYIYTLTTTYQITTSE